MAPTPTDPLVVDSWHLKNTGQTYTDGDLQIPGVAGFDTRVEGAWASGYTGQGVAVAVSDDGVQGNHPDLAGNIDLNQSFDVANDTQGGGPVQSDDDHGTEVSGVVAAVADNGVGSAGVAYDATLISVRHGQNTGGTLDDDAQNQELIDAFDYQTQHGVDVSNNSYGPDGPGPSDPAFLAAIEKFATEGRDGLGGVATFAAGNERVLTLSANLEGEENSPYAIPVAAVDQTGKFSIFSCFGANILVSAPGENIETTAPVGQGDSEGNYSLVDGTSFATPAVSGVAALILEANPELTGKDVQEILAMSARHPDEMTSYFSSVADAQAARPEGQYENNFIQPGELAKLVTPWDWEINGAKDWNGGGMHVSHDYGFGMVDATAAIRLAETWQSANSPEFDQIQAKGTGNAADGISVTVQDAEFTVAKASVTLDFAGAGPATQDDALNFAQSLDVRLISPEGTVSYLVYGFDAERYKTVEQRISDNQQSQDGGDTSTAGSQAAGTQPDAGQPSDGSGDSSDDDGVFLLTSTHSWGEQAGGEWKILAVDKTTGAPIPLDGWTLDLWGADDHVNNNYVYTDEYKELAGADTLRQVLVDQNGGQDTADFAAVTSAVKVALDGSEGTVGGTPWKVDATTGIERVIGGDGNDQIAGNDENNWLRSMRGDDFMSGGIGNDRLEGGAGNDRLIGQDGNDRLFGDDDQDTLNGGEGQDLLSGGRGDDLLLGQDGDDLLFGFAGRDRLEGGAGDDKLNAGDGNDMVVGGGGDDIIVHGLGDDMIDGGAGTDVLEVGFASSNYRLDGSSTAGSLIDIGNPSANPGTDTFTSIEMVRFTDQTLSFNGSNWLPAVG